MINSKYRATLQLDFDTPGELYQYLRWVAAEVGSDEGFTKYADEWPHSSTLYAPQQKATVRAGEVVAYKPDKNKQVGRLFVGPADQVRAITATGGNQNRIQD